MFYLPVVLSLALVGFIWQLFYSTDQGSINAAFGSNVDLAWRPEHQPVVGAHRHVVATHRLHHAALPGRPEGRRRVAGVVAAAGRRGRRGQDVLPLVILPVMRPINLIVLVMVVIESLRAFDLVRSSTRAASPCSRSSALVARTSSVRRRIRLRLGTSPSS